MPSARTIADIKSKLLHPALTSHFEVTIPLPTGFQGKNGQIYLQANQIYQFAGTGGQQDKLNLLCCETSLPGSNIGTMDITGDYHGVTVRHANRRIYDDRIDMTFYVDADNYLPIRYFETWMKYVVGESITESNGRPGAKAPNYFYRLNYPDLYIAKQGLSVTKFERTGSKSLYTGKLLTYQFVNVFPISIASMPVSYDASSLLKCTVSFSYVRYYIQQTGAEPEHEDSSESSSTTGDPSSPLSQAAFNNIQFNSGAYIQDLNLDYANYTITGGVDYSSALSSGNSVDVNTAFNSNTSLL